MKGFDHRSERFLSFVHLDSGCSFHFNAAAYDPVRMPNLMATG